MAKSISINIKQKNSKEIYINQHLIENQNKTAYM